MRERQFLSLSYHTILTKLPGRTPTSQHYSLNSTFQHYGQTPTSQPHGWTPTSTVCLNGREPNFLPTWPKVNFGTASFSKSSNSRDHCFQAWCHSHSSIISYQGFIMTIVIVISFSLEHKLYPMLCTWTKSQIVQSPTKLNDKIWLTKND